jgi:hypothetical protein
LRRWSAVQLAARLAGFRDPDRRRDLVKQAGGRRDTVLVGRRKALDAALMAEILRSAAADKLRASGVAVESGPHLIHTDADGLFGPAGWQEWMAFIRDTEGNLIGLASRHAPD